MFEALAVIPVEELALRLARCRRLLRELNPDAGGLLVFNRPQVYYLTGTMGMGCVWLPLEGEPLLMLRKGIARAALEAPSTRCVGYRSYKDLPDLAAEAGVPFPEVVAVDQGGMTWQLGEMLAARLSSLRFVSGDLALAIAQSHKSEWELQLMRLCGERHHMGLYDILPRLIRPGMSERAIAHLAWGVFFELGHQGVLRMSAFGEEAFLGHVSAGDSGNYPSSFNGPLGLRGEHPAAPVMGYAGHLWQPGHPLGLDIGFQLEGYHTDKTQTYWAGKAGSIPVEVASAHSFCVDVQAWLAENLRPGTLVSELYAHCAAWAVKAGFGEGFMGLGENKVPFLGHGIGLAIDGYPAIAKGFDRPVERGQVFALEPKHGIPGLGMVGVENTFEVTDAGAVCITGDRYDMVCVE
ncbi:MAG: aminopeptidase P family protein [Deltaproteobacteria bacterium HGW-Deltaproteobacteria-8]|jgi:Xaa-Pro aminopeptidase|nr:MAG: aminopeptidase P family protein [Deltaproteobacteria bacterium HGW-Deltaproteobacteria-8]